MVDRGIGPDRKSSLEDPINHADVGKAPGSEEDELAAEAQRAEFQRDQDVRNEVNKVVVHVVRYGSWFAIVFILAVASILAFHYLAPSDWAWLNDAQIERIDSIFRTIGFVATPFLIRMFYTNIPKG